MVRNGRVRSSLFVGLLESLGLLDPHEWARLSVTPGPWCTLIWGCLALYLVGLLVFYPIATAAAHRLLRWSAVWIALVGACTRARTSSSSAEQRCSGLAKARTNGFEALSEQPCVEAVREVVGVYRPTKCR